MAGTADILIVESESLIREGLSRAMRNLGNVKAVGSGEEAILEAALKPYALCFLDLTLPGKDGIRTGRELRELLPEMRIVTMTANFPGKHVARAIEGFACRLLPKPFSHAEVQAVAMEALESRLAPSGRSRERRSEERNALLKPVSLTLTLSNQNSDPVSHSIRVIDLSRGGIGLNSAHKIEAGTRVLVDHKPGIVRWRKFCTPEVCTAGVQLDPG